jgi:glutamate racemase
MLTRALLLGVLAFTHAVADDAVRPLIEHVAAHREGRAAWSIDFSALDTDRATLPIGVFDSGIGGLTVLEAILGLDAFHNDTLRPGADGKPDFAGERFIYFGDQANMPYGNYPAKGREDFLRELIVKDAAFLLGTRWRSAADAPPRFDKRPVKAIVIACNTATAYGLEDIRTALREWKLNVPVIGVIEAGARATAAALPDDGKPHAVGVLATVGTCASGAYPKAIARATGQAGKSAPVVVQQGSANLAAAIESGQREAISSHASADVKALVQQHTGGQELEAVVLGCTHFPLARNELSDAFKAAALDGVRFIDPADSTARELFRELARARLRTKGDAVPSAEFFLSVPNPVAPGVKLAADGSLDRDYKADRKLGRFNTEDTVAIPLTIDTLPEGSAKLVRSLPTVWHQFEGARAAR